SKRAGVRTDLGLRGHLPARLDVLRRARLRRGARRRLAGGTNTGPRGQRGAYRWRDTGAGRPVPAFATQARLLVKVSHASQFHPELVARGLLGGLPPGVVAWRLLPRLLLAPVRYSVRARRHERGGEGGPYRAHLR